LNKKGKFKDKKVWKQYRGKRAEMLMELQIAHKESLEIHSMNETKRRQREEQVRPEL
jgi:hypothetical protein